MNPLPAKGFRGVASKCVLNKNKLHLFSYDESCVQNSLQKQSLILLSIKTREHTVILKGIKIKPLFF